MHGGKRDPGLLPALGYGCRRAACCREHHRAGAGVIAQFNGNWSFSWLMKYESCAHLFKLGKIDKLPQLEPEKDNPLERGNRVHKCYELYIKGESDLFDEEAKCS